jgi:hypothetical protein
MFKRIGSGLKKNYNKACLRLFVVPEKMKNYLQHTYVVETLHNLVFKHPVSNVKCLSLSFEQNNP